MTPDTTAIRARPSLIGMAHLIVTEEERDALCDGYDEAQLLRLAATREDVQRLITERDEARRLMAVDFDRARCAEDRFAALVADLRALIDQRGGLTKADLRAVIDRHAPDTTGGAG